MIVTLVPFMSKMMGKPQKVERKLKPCFNEMDIVGYNYAEQCYEPHHKRNPDRVMVASETYPPLLAKNWKYIEKSPHVIGDFMWTAWDYLGEAGVGAPVYGASRGGFNRPFPCVSAGCGAIDMTGHAETMARYASIIWNMYQKPYIAVRPVNHSGEKYFFGMWRGTDAVNSWSWTGMEGKRAEIEVYSLGKKVELFQDGTSLGKKELIDCRAFFETCYMPGELNAVSYDENGRKLDESILVSADETIDLTVRFETDTIKADNEDLMYASVEITDKNGIKKLLCDRRVHVEVEGAGVLAGIGSGNPFTTDSFTGEDYNTHFGRMIFIVRSNGKIGKIRIKVSADGMKERIFEKCALN